MKIGIIGLPNVGKSTLFQALTKKQVNISNYPFCTIEPNVGIVAVPDERLGKIAELIWPGPARRQAEKITPAIIEFVDIAGLVKNAHKGEGLGNQFLSHIREVDMICHVVRCFEDEKIIHIEGKINPLKDIETTNLELIMKDLEIVQKRLEKTEKDAKDGDQKLLKELKKLKILEKWLNEGNLIREINEQEKLRQLVKELQLLTFKPVVYVANIQKSDPINDIGDKQKIFLKSMFGTKFESEIERSPAPYKGVALNLKQELELSELTPEEIKELELAPSEVEGKLDQLISICYDVLNLITFYTIAGEKETRAWSIEKNTKAAEAALKIHTDFAKFIRAEVINWQKLIGIGSIPNGRQVWQGAREKGLIKTEGKEYIVQDGDVIEFKL